MKIKMKHNPSVDLPFVISLPHCSGRVPEDIRPTIALSDEQIEESTDMGTKEIFGSIPVHAVVCARWSRLVVDLNRDSDQWDSKGIIALKDYHGRIVYRNGCIPDKQETESRIKDYYRPFHDELKAALNGSNIIGLFDCHSMNGIGPPEAPDAGKKRSDIVLGNNGDVMGNENPDLGKITCPAETLKMISTVFQNSGFSVSINDPYPGGFITNHYGQELARKRKIAVQIEINQELFLEPGTSKIAVERLRVVMAEVFRSFEVIARQLMP
jgi:N-formylglutamate amidohydrolase